MPIDITQMVNSSTWIIDFDPRSPVLLDFNSFYPYYFFDRDYIFEDLRDVLWVDLFELVPSRKATEFGMSTHVGIDV